MCQLHFVSTPDTSFNRAFILAASSLSSSVGNDDGVGVYSQEWGLFKTELPAHVIVNFGNLLSEHKEPSTQIMAHTRAASTGIEVSQENAHPFEGKRFILAHNGRLWKKNDKVTYLAQQVSEGLSSDSKEFLDALEKYALENPDKEFYPIISEVMAEHKGKFALLIFDKKFNRFYAVRGKTAPLHYLPINSSGRKGAKQIGYCITTQEGTLATAANLACNIFQLSGGKFSIGTVEELKPETAYLLTQTEPVSLGEVKEVAANFTQPTQSASQSGTGWGLAKVPSVSSGKTHSDSKELEPDMFLGTFMNAHKLSVIDMDKIFYGIFGYGLLEATIEDIIVFAKYCNKMAVKKKIRKMLARSYTIPMYYNQYEANNLVYPWMINSEKRLIEVNDKPVK